MLVHAQTNLANKCNYAIRQQNFGSLDVFVLLIIYHGRTIWME